MYPFRIYSLYILSSLIAYTLPAQDLGIIDFPTAGKGEAQQYFIEGTLLLHSFEFEDAAEAYQRAQQLAPGFAMAYWGEAMTYYHPLWDYHNAEKAQDALKKLGATPSERQTQAPTQKEKDWLQAVEILFAEGDHREQIKAYSDFMRQLYEKYPHDHEVASFYAISILGTSFGSRDSYKYMRAAAIVEEVYAENEYHPGALHYLIHSYDDPVHAPLGMRAAKRYAQVAPSAAHALHMPSHIFVAMGMWPEVVASNEASSAAADARRARKSLGVDSRGYHSLHWLEYGYLQQERYEDAEKLLWDMKSNFEESESRRAAFHLSVMRAGYLVETSNWSHEAVSIKIPSDKLTQKAKAVDYFVQGWAHLEVGDILKAKKYQEMLETLAPMAMHIDMGSGAQTSCCSPNYSTTDDDDPGTIHAIHVMNMELDAMMKYRSGRKAEAFEILRLATEMETNMDFMFGPPIIVKPSYELLGEMLLKEGRFEEAIEAFKTALQRAPGRTLSLKSLAQAYQSVGNQDKADEIVGRLNR